MVARTHSNLISFLKWKLCVNEGGEALNVNKSLVPVAATLFQCIFQLSNESSV